MKPKGLLIAVVLLAVLAGVVFWSNKKQEAASKTPADSSTKILNIPDDQLQEVRIKKLTGEVIDLRRESGKWLITEPTPLAADQDAVSSLTGSLTSLNADKVVEDTATDLKQYGLDIPTLDITITKKDGKTDEVLIGNDTLTGSGAYVKLAAGSKIFSVGSTVKTSIDKRPDDLRDKRLLSFESDKLTRVELNAKGQPVEFGKNGSGEWQIVKPAPLRADSTQVDTLVGKLRDAKMDVNAPDPDAAKKYAAAPKVATASVSDSAGTQTLEVHKTKDNDYYAKSSAVDGIYKIAKDVGDALDKSRDDFRNKKLFDFGFSDPSRVEFKGAIYTKMGDKWMVGSKPMDNSSVQALIDKLRDFASTKFTEKGGGEPVFDATVVSNSGKRIEKVAVKKQGDHYFAQRENEPSIYEVDAKAVEDLQKASTDVKEAPPEPAKKK